MLFGPVNVSDLSMCCRTHENRQTCQKIHFGAAQKERLSRGQSGCQMSAMAKSQIALRNTSKLACSTLLAVIARLQLYFSVSAIAGCPGMRPSVRWNTAMKPCFGTAKAPMDGTRLPCQRPWPTPMNLRYTPTDLPATHFTTCMLHETNDRDASRIRLRSMLGLKKSRLKINRIPRRHDRSVFDLTSTDKPRTMWPLLVSRITKFIAKIR